MSPLTFSIAAALLSSALTAGILYKSRCTQEHEAEGLRYQNSRLQYQAYQQIQSQQRPAKSAVSEEGAAPKLKAPPAGSGLNYRNEGQSTPLASLQTFVWACDQGDTERVADMLYFESEDRKRAEAYFAALPEKARAKWQSLDEMAATLLIISSMARSFPSAEVLAAAPVKIISENRVSCGVPYQIQFQQTNGVWKYVITAAALEKLEKEISASFAAKGDS